MSNQKNKMWKTIKAFPLYEVSLVGEIRNKRTKRHLKTRVLRSYESVGLIEEETGIQRTAFVHRCVASAFLDNPNNLPTINHKDGNKLNNHVDNLEWCTYSQNLIHAYATGLKKPSINPNKRPVRQLDRHGNLINVYASTFDAWRKTGIRHISEVVCGHRKSAGGYLWEDA